MENEQEDQLPQGAQQFSCPLTQQMADALALTLTHTSITDDAGGEDEPSYLPPFANAENRALDAQIRVSGMLTQSLHGPCSMGHASYASHDHG
jgi:hypothetical protein